MLCGPFGTWDTDRLKDLMLQFPGLFTLKHLTRDEVEGTLVDLDGEALARLGVEITAQYTVRPDGQVGLRCAGTDLGRMTEYLVRWFGPAPRS
jgi:hypothetical protein